MPTYGLQIQYWLYNSQQSNNPLSVNVPPGQTHNATAVYKRVPKPAYLNVFAVNEAGGGERVKISYSGDLTRNQTTPFQLVVYQLDGLQVTLTAPQKVDTGSYYLTFARWVYQGQSYYSTSLSVSVPPTQTRALRCTSAPTRLHKRRRHESGDERTRLVKVTYTSGGYVKVGGQQVPSG
jgi:hypothetical protein